MRIRDGILVALLAFAMALAPAGVPMGAEAPLPHDEPLSELRIGYQKGGPLLILKSSGELDRRLGNSRGVGGMG